MSPRLVSSSTDMAMGTESDVTFGRCLLAMSDSVAALKRCPISSPRRNRPSAAQRLVTSSTAWQTGCRRRPNVQQQHQRRPLRSVWRRGAVQRRFCAAIRTGRMTEGRKARHLILVTSIISASFFACLCFPWPSRGDASSKDERERIGRNGFLHDLLGLLRQSPSIYDAEAFARHLRMNWRTPSEKWRPWWKSRSSKQNCDGDTSDVQIQAAYELLQRRFPALQHAVRFSRAVDCISGHCFTVSSPSILSSARSGLSRCPSRTRHCAFEAAVVWNWPADCTGLSNANAKECQPGTRQEARNGVRHALWYQQTVNRVSSGGLSVTRPYPCSQGFFNDASGTECPSELLPECRDIQLHHGVLGLAKMGSGN